MPDHPLLEPSPTVTPSDAPLLDNPIWSALTTEHASLALGDTHARRYPPYIGPLSGIADQSPASYAALHPLAGPSGVIVLFSVEQPQPTAQWTSIRDGFVDQMICSRGNEKLISAPSNSLDLRQLTSSDAEAMVALAELAEPGPFRLRTLELGTFYGVFHSGQLAAMAGKRMHLPGHIEVSGVCTHPDARGRGYAALLMSRVMEEILEAGKTPILHVLSSNHSAIRVYEKLGFHRRQTFHLAVLKSE